MKTRLTALKAAAEAARQTPAYRAAGASIRFTEALVARMEVCGVSRSALAEKIGSSPAYVTKILRGDTNFTLGTMAKIAAALDCELSIDLQPTPKAKPQTPASYHATKDARSPVLNDEG